MPLTIKSIRPRAVNVPLRKPHPTAGGSVTSAPLVLIDLETSEGVTGRSYLFGYTALVLKPLAQLVQSLGELLTGDPVMPLDLNRKLQARLRLLGQQGLAGMAVAGIDMAAWDAAAVAAGLPLASFLGGAPKPVAAYHSCGMSGVEGSRADAEETVALGFDAIKFKVGHADVAQDVAAIRAARDAGLKVMVDYNQSLDIVSAIARGRVLDQEGLVWIEEPTTAEDYAGHAQIAAAINTPVQMGENMWGPGDVAKALDARASDAIMLDVMKIGGITGWLAAMALADARGIRVSSHLFPEISAQLLSVARAPQYLEYQDWAAPILQEPIVVAKGLAQTTTRPGMGLAWDEDFIALHLV